MKASLTSFYKRRRDKFMSIFKAYDIRGVYPQELNEEVAYKVARAMVQFVKKNHPSPPPSPRLRQAGQLSPARGEGDMRVVVGRDHRLSSPALYRAVVQGLCDEGASVIDVGVVSTPMFNFAVAAYPVHDAGVMITASHNPKEYNGLKLCTAGARPIGQDSGMDIIEQGVAKLKTQNLNLKTTTQNLKVKKLDILRPYIDKVVSLVSPYELTSLRAKVVVDPANGLGSIACAELLKRFPNIILIPLYFDLDGTFPHHEANPLKTETLKDLQEKVVAEHADLGVAYDGDADRIGFVDEGGQIIPIDLMGALLARERIGQNKGGKVLGDVRTSRVLQEEVEKAGGEFLLERVGHAFMKLRMKKEQALMGVELSGHYYWGDFYNIECADLALLLLLTIMAGEKKPLSRIMAPLKRYFHSGEINFTVEDKGKKMQEIFERYQGQASSIETLDGIRMDFDNSGLPSEAHPHQQSTPVLMRPPSLKLRRASSALASGGWWFSLRPSNTESLLRLNVEAGNQRLMEEKRDELIKILKLC
jgi:phosphomannomutase